MAAPAFRRHLASAMVATALTGLGVAAAQGGYDGGPMASEAARAMSSTDRQREAERIVQHARELRSTLETRLDAATRRSDIVMVDCLTPLRTQLEATLGSAEQRARAIRLLANSEGGAAAHEFTMLSVLGQRFQIIEADMNQCLGDSDITTGDDQLTVEVTIDIPPEDPTAVQPPPPDLVVPFIPPPLSPAM